MPESIDEVYKLADGLGLVVNEFRLDGLWHRVPVAGKSKRDLRGAYCLSEFPLQDGRKAIVGMLFHWGTQQEERLTLDGISGVTPAEAEEARRRMREAAEASKREKAAVQRETAQRARTIWDKLPESGRSQYLQDKGVKAWGIRFSKGAICVPARDEHGEIWSLQFIQPDGSKRFLSGGAKRGKFHQIGCPPDGRTPFVLGLAEGYATGATIHELKQIPVAIAFDAGNLLPVAQLLRRMYPEAQIVIFADHDRFNGYPQAFIQQRDSSLEVREQIRRLREARPDVAVEIVADDDPRLSNPDKHYNTGVTRALIAAAAIDGDVLVPRFEDKPTTEDINHEYR